MAIRYVIIVIVVIGVVFVDDAAEVVDAAAVSVVV